VVDVCLDGPETATVWGEESEVLAIVDNLLTNAERHGAEGPIRVEIAADDETIRLSVTNRGELPAGDPEAVFHRGFSTHPDGEGLGLARARMLADINGGELQVATAEPGHTSFLLSLKGPRAGASVGVGASRGSRPGRGENSVVTGAVPR
jgi:signal transduction histidine kinase